MDLDLLEWERKHNKAKLLKNSTLLKQYKSSNYPEVISVVDHLYEEMVKVYGLNLTRPSDIERLRYHMEFFALNLYKTYCNDPTKLISYPRAANVYSDKKSKYRIKFGLSYRYSVEKGKNGKGVINFLERQGYIETFGFQYDQKNPNNRYQSRMRATEKLIDLIVTQYEVSESMLEEDTRGDELIIVKGLKPKPQKIKIVENGKKKTKTIKRLRKICKTPDTRRVREMRNNLELINEVMEKADITLDVSDEELQELNERMRADRNPHKQSVDINKKSLHRVFLDRRLDRGGRFYGAWYQNIPPEYRERILINGAPVLEPDFSGYHPRILYALKGLPLPDDPYSLEGYPDTEELRKFFKNALLTIVNTMDEKTAIRGIRGARSEELRKAARDGKVVKPLGIEPLTDQNLLKVMQLLMVRHKPIEDFFYSKHGTRLQYIDSQIAEAILLHFAKMGKACLPMHDSFIVDARLSKELMRVMDEIVHQGLKQEIGIKHNMDQLFYRLTDKIIEDLEQGNVDKDRWEEFNKEIREKIPKWEKQLAEAEAQAEAEDQARLETP